MYKTYSFARYQGVYTLKPLQYLPEFSLGFTFSSKRTTTQLAKTVAMNARFAELIRYIHLDCILDIESSAKPLVIELAAITSLFNSAKRLQILIVNIYDQWDCLCSSQLEQLYDM